MLNSDYSDMLRVLSGHNVKFMLVGGFALAAHGYPRTTLDIDLWVLASNYFYSEVGNTIVFRPPGTAARWHCSTH
jgi:hypothetical protein